MKRVVALVMACMAVVACAGIPTNGPVRQGDTEVAQQPPLAPLLQGPAPDASPRAIVQGFLSASAGGSVSGFDVAREFLTEGAAITWDPMAQVTIFDSRQVEQTFDASSGVHTYTVPVAAIVDESGVMTEASADVQSDITFTVTQDEFGRNRISTLADGIVMSAADFVRFFRPLRLYFAGADFYTAIPEVRWFANNDQIATAVVRELVAGPSPWLADAVTTGFPPGSALDVDAVVINDGVATVALAPGSAGSLEQRALGVAQLELTLGQVPAVQSVVVTVGGVPLSSGVPTELVQPALPPEMSAVIAQGRLGLFDGDEIAVTPWSTGTVPEGASGLALAYDGVTVAMVVDGSIAASSALAHADALEMYDDRAEPPGQVPQIPVQTVIPGQALVPASFDPQGWVWSTEQDSQGVVYAATADPGTIAAGSVHAEPIALEAPWMDGREVQALAVSRDGSRLAVLSRTAGSVQSLDIVAITRDGQGVPLSLGQPLSIAPTIPPSIDLVWSDSTSVVTVAEESGLVTESEIGGWTHTDAVLVGAEHITIRNGTRTLVATTADGALVVRSGNSWTGQADGIYDVSYAG